MNPQLFDNFTIGNVELANRFVRSATWEGMCDEQGRPQQRLHKLYATLAEGGVGLIISGYTYVRDDGRQLPGKMGIDRDELIVPLSQLTRTVHEAGGRIFCQLVHAGGQTSAKAIGRTPLAPSALKADNYPETPEELSREEIGNLVAAFGEAARRAREAGFDGVQLHGAHGYLVNQFLSPLNNQRRDDYGGSLENRMRFLEEVHRKVRASVGADYPVTIKLTASDNQEGGFTLEEAVIVAQRLAAEGMDAIEVSSGTVAAGPLGPARQGIDSEVKEAYNADNARRIKQAVDIPVITVGGVRSLAVMERHLEKGAADAFALSRPFIREPQLVNTWRENPQHRATCISCNGCFRPGMKGEGIYCVVDRIEEKNSAPTI